MIRPVREGCLAPLRGSEKPRGVTMTDETIRVPPRIAVEAVVDAFARLVIATDLVRCEMTAQLTAFIICNLFLGPAKLVPLACRRFHHTGVVAVLAFAIVVSACCFRL